MLDDRVGNPSPFGGVQFHSRQAQLVDDADEGTGPHRWPEGEDSHANHPTFGLGDNDRRGGNEEQVAQIVGVVALGSRIGLVARQQSDGGVEIGQSGAADVNLHKGPQRGYGRAIAASVLLDDPSEDTTDRA